MKNRYVCLAVWLLLACLLYFFENNTGSRAVLACSLLLPFVPVLRHSLFDQDKISNQPQAFPQTGLTFAEREDDDPGDVRAYLPGDPVNRIHWKLSAKRDELLVREREKEKTAEEAKKKALFLEETPDTGSSRMRVILIGVSVILLAFCLLFAVPSAAKGMEALLNRLYDASEAVNAYAYDRFDVPAGQSIVFAVASLVVIMLSLIGITILSGSRWLALGLMAGCVFFQVYFGLAFPGWVNVSLFALFALWMMKRPWNRKAAMSMLSGVAVLALAVLLFWPGVDAATEGVSETVRDRLSQMALHITGAYHELPAGKNETRHTHTQSLTAGDQEAHPDREYLLVTVEEERIAMPHWVNYLRIILLLLLVAALVILPFLPFLLLNQRRKKALDTRKAFESENVSEAVFAIFQHITAWLEATGNGAGNLPYAEWSVDLAPDYAQRFVACEKLFEEAAYSAHGMTEEQRRQALELLNETERMLQQKADWKQRLRLKYKECLWV